MTCLRDCVECETDQAIEALRGPVSPESPDPYTGKGQDVPGAQRGHSRPAMGILSPVMRPAAGLDGPHSFGCALVTRSGACDCTPNLRTTSRGFTYDLGQMLGEGWYDDDV